MKEATTNGPFLLPNSIYFLLPISLPTYIPTFPHHLSISDPHIHTQIHIHMHIIHIHACILKCMYMSFIECSHVLKFIKRVTRKVNTMFYRSLMLIKTGVGYDRWSPRNYDYSSLCLTKKKLLSHLKYLNNYWYFYKFVN